MAASQPMSTSTVATNSGSIVKTAQLIYQISTVPQNDLINLELDSTSTSTAPSAWAPSWVALYSDSVLNAFTNPSMEVELTSHAYSTNFVIEGQPCVDC